MVKINMAFFVESIPKGKKSLNLRRFETRRKAEMFAQRELKMGRGVAINLIRRGGKEQKIIFQRNLGVTPFAMEKFGKIFTRDFGKFKTL